MTLTRPYNARRSHYNKRTQKVEEMCVHGDILLTINVDEIFYHMARKALVNNTGRASKMNGLISARAAK